MTETDKIEPKRPARHLSGAELRDGLRELKARFPTLRARDAAKELGVSEAELLACRTGDDVVRLEPDFAGIIHTMPSVGEVLVLTRNEHCVHEKHGRFDNIVNGPGDGVAVNSEIDLRLFLRHWRHGFILSEETASGVRTSLQVFDIDGVAVHKIYLTAESDRAAFDALVERFRGPRQSSDIEIVPLPPRGPDRPDSEIDAARLHEHWRMPQDPEAFFALLEEFGIGRAQALRLSGSEFAHRVGPAALRTVLERVVETRTPIMCVVSNPGCIQIHTGLIETLKTVGPWFNVLDPRFNLHLREDAVDQAWVVRKPDRDGIVTSLELFNADGFCLAQFFGERQPGKPGSEAWRAILAEASRL